MKRLASFIVVAAVACLSPGCGRTLDPAADQGLAEKALQTALEAWKSGRSQDDLQRGSPSILMNEDDWRTGKRLVDFRMEKPALNGRQVQCRVHITLQESDGKPVDRDAVYIIDTTPRIVIVRDTFAS